MRGAVGLVLFSCLSGALAACAPDDYGDEYALDPNTQYYGPDGGGFSGDGGPNAAPMAVKVDPGGTLLESPGQGVGVFTEYVAASDADAGPDAGGSSSPRGHWFIWWTCDTNLSGQDCAFDITVTARTGEITNAVAQGFASGDALTSAVGDGGSALDADAASVDGGAALGPTASFEAITDTTTVIQGVRFDTYPGAEILVSAALETSIGPQYSGSFFFFVQDGKTNGGYTGTLTDPLDFQPSSP